jgi:hypothetical protein
MFGILLDKTNFYAESGGQENDTGSLTIDGKADFEVTDVQVFNGYVLHVGYMKEGEVKVGDEVVCTYSEVSSGIQQIPSGASRDTGIDRMIRIGRNDDGLLETITPPRTFSTSVCEKSWVTTLTRRDRWSLLPSFDSTSATRPPSLPPISKRSRPCPTNG